MEVSSRVLKHRRRVREWRRRRRVQRAVQRASSQCPVRGERQRRRMRSDLQRDRRQVEEGRREWLRREEEFRQREALCRQRWERILWERMVLSVSISTWMCVGALMQCVARPTTEIPTVAKQPWGTGVVTGNPIHTYSHAFICVCCDMEMEMCVHCNV